MCYETFICVLLGKNKQGTNVKSHAVHHIELVMLHYSEAAILHTYCNGKYLC